MECRLCLNVEPNLLDIQSDEAIQTNVPTTLYKYFRFCFSNDSRSGCVCHRCWTVVQSFDALYMRVEAIHHAPIKSESIFLEKSNAWSNDGCDFDDTHPESKNAAKKRTRKRAKEPSKSRVEVKCDAVASIKADDDDKDVREDPNDELNRSRSLRLQEVALQKAQKARKPSYKTNYKTTTRKGASKVFQCTTCDVPFLTEYKLYCHTKEVHMVKPYKCPEPKCVESFDAQDNLDRHVEQNHSRIQCPQCKKKMKLYYLPQHIKLYHDKDQRIVCDLCGNVSRNKNTHKTHHLLVHDVQPRLQCDICKEWSRNKNSLREHMRTRHIQKPETCPICGKVSANKKALMKHKRFHFAEAREKYKCQVCGHGFRDSTKLKEHSYIHSGISDVHRCSYCEKSFRFASSMYAHRKKAHAVEEQLRADEKTNYIQRSNE